MLTADAGTPVIIETTIKLYTPFGSSVESDPDTPPTITVTDSKGNIKVTAQAMSQNSTGEYYYVIPTATDWLKTTYDAEIIAAFAPNTDVHLEKRSFKLE